MKKCISVLCLGLLLTMTEVVDASPISPIVVDFNISLKVESISTNPKKVEVTATRLNSISIRPGNPRISESAEDVDAECKPVPMGNAGTSADKYSYITVAINGSDVNGLFEMVKCLPVDRPYTEVKSNQMMANELISSLWGGLNIWREVYDGGDTLPRPIVDLGQPVSVCLGIGADEDMCNDGKGVTKPVDPIDPTVTCSLPTSVELQHGTLDSKDVNGNSLSKSVIITCTGTTTADISVGATANSNDGAISLGGGINSLVKINNSAGHANLNLKSGSNSVGLSSVLSSSGESKSGTYKGSGVLTLSID